MTKREASDEISTLVIPAVAKRRAGIQDGNIAE
jgi:hypothetical protein